MPLPCLFIVAGPNGSGKSLFSKMLTESDFEVFDGDKHMTELVKQFPETGSEALLSYIDEAIFGVQKAEAIRLKRSYAFETNFSSVNPMSTAKEFQETGYEVHLIFMGLNSLEESIQRVATRVKTGGHKVSEESIRYNFEQGHKNLYNHFNEFTTVTLFNNAIAGTDEETEPVEILFIADGKLHLHTMNYPDWSKPLVDGFDQDHISYAAEG